jgi:hypothetical protein
MNNNPSLSTYCYSDPTPFPTVPPTEKRTDISTKISAKNRLNGQFRGKYQFAANALLKTIDFELEDIKNWAILDSGATSHFLLSTAPATNIRPTQMPLRAKLPNGEAIESTAECDLMIPGLPEAARRAHVI